MLKDCDNFVKYVIKQEESNFERTMDAKDRRCMVFSYDMLSALGSAFPCIKIGYKMFHIASADASLQLLFAGCRFFLAGFLVLLLGTSGKYKLKRRKFPWQ